MLGRERKQTKRYLSHGVFKEGLLDKAIFEQSLVEVRE